MLPPGVGNRRHKSRLSFPLILSRMDPKQLRTQQRNDPQQMVFEMVYRPLTTEEEGLSAAELVERRRRRLAKGKAKESGMCTVVMKKPFDIFSVRFLPPSSGLAQVIPFSRVVSAASYTDPSMLSRSDVSRRP